MATVTRLSALPAATLRLGNGVVADTQLPRIVVGVDGSAECARALAYAADLAGHVGATLDVVVAFEAASPTPTGYLLDSLSVDRAKQVARDVLDETVEAALSDREALVATRVAIQGRPGDVLVARAEGAQMLVVGGHGPRGPLGGLRLGSVAAHCVRHAPCPVLVVRGRVTGLGAGVMKSGATIGADTA